MSNFKQWLEERKIEEGVFDNLKRPLAAGAMSLAAMGANSTFAQPPQDQTQQVQAQDQKYQDYLKEINDIENWANRVNVFISDDEAEKLVAKMTKLLDGRKTLGNTPEENRETLANSLSKLMNRLRQIIKIQKGSPYVYKSLDYSVESLRVMVWSVKYPHLNNSARPPRMPVRNEP